MLILCVAKENYLDIISEVVSSSLSKDGKKHPVDKLNDFHGEK